MPTGMSIIWDYEPNLYDCANNVSLSEADVKYGGGIRVKKMIVNNGLGDEVDYSYFYTDMQTAGDFEEHSPLDNSSGHASVEPALVISSKSTDHKYRPKKTRGDLYTPTKNCLRKSCCR